MSQADKKISYPFQELQYQFTAHLRNPKKNKVPEGLEDRRVNVYRELIYNNIESFLSGSFPILRKIYTDDEWHPLVRAFIVYHQAHSPYFSKIPEEFIQFLGQECPVELLIHPFTVELAHYEWIEIPILRGTLEVPDTMTTEGVDFLTQHPVVSNLAAVLTYQYPVHQLGPSFTPQEPGDNPTHLIVYRDRDEKVCFLEINAVTARLLNIISDSPKLTGQAALMRLADEMQHPEPETVLTFGLQILNDMFSKGVILGTMSIDN